MRINKFAHAGPRLPTHEVSKAQLKSASRGYAVKDGFDGGAAKSVSMPKLEAELQKTLAPMLERLMAKLTELLAKLQGGTPGETPAPAPGQPASPGAPSAPAGADLAPTPVNPNVPGQEAKVNTIKNPHVAPKSQFRNAVNAAIDRVREQGIGIDPNDRDAITDFDTYHNAVVTELRRSGYNAAYDGEELAVGRKGDSFSEQFDISTWQGRVRRFYASHLTPPVWA
ncbi:MAG: hypothetical protein ACYC8T_24615 [Myxococcaceae bacterium]